MHDNKETLALTRSMPFRGEKESGEEMRRVWRFLRGPMATMITWLSGWEARTWR